MSCGWIAAKRGDPPICLHDADGNAGFQALIVSINGLTPRIAIARFVL